MNKLQDTQVMLRWAAPCIEKPHTKGQKSCECGSGGE